MEEDEDEPVDNHGSRVDGLYGQEEESDDVEEGRQGKTGAPPRRLSAEQVQSHRLAHHLVSSWCLLSIAGRAKKPHFRQKVGDDGGVPIICFDCCFWRDRPGGESVPVLVGRERRTKMMLAHLVPLKGGGVDRFVEQLLRVFIIDGCPRSGHFQE